MEGMHICAGDRPQMRATVSIDPELMFPSTPAIDGMLLPLYDWPIKSMCHLMGHGRRQTLELPSRLPILNR